MLMAALKQLDRLNASGGSETTVMAGKKNGKECGEVHYGRHFSL